MNQKKPLPHPDRRGERPGKRSTDCGGEDCPQFLKQTTKVEKLGTGQKIILAIMISTFAFQAITYRSLSNFVKGYNETRLAEAKLESQHLVEMEVINQKQIYVMGRLIEIEKWQEAYDKGWHNHMEKYHSP